MTEEEKEAIEILRFSPIFRGRKPENDCLEIVLNLIGKLQKELEEKTTILMVGADKVKQLEKENQELKEDNSHQWEERCRLTFELERLQKENEELKAINSMQKYRIEVIDERELISKEEIREFIKKELPDDEIMECCSICDVNGVAIRKELEKILADKE